MTSWTPELVDLVRPRDRARYDDGIRTDDLVWAGLARAGVAAGRALHEAVANRLATVWVLEAASSRATEVLRAALYVRGVEVSPWLIHAEVARRGLAVRLIMIDPPPGEPSDEVKATVRAIYLGIEIGMSYPIREARP